MGSSRTNSREEDEEMFCREFCREEGEEGEAGRERMAWWRACLRLWWG